MKWEVQVDVLLKGVRAEVSDWRGLPQKRRDMPFIWLFVALIWKNSPLSRSNLSSDGSPAAVLGQVEQDGSYSALSTAQLDSGEQETWWWLSETNSKDRTIQSLKKNVPTGDREQPDGDRRAAPAACADSMNSYAHTGRSRNTGPARTHNKQHTTKERWGERLLCVKPKLFWFFSPAATDTTATSEYTQQVYQGSKWVEKGQKWTPQRVSFRVYIKVLIVIL